MESLCINSAGRARFTRFRIERVPDGRVLEKNKAPVGYRTPNALVWAHSLDEFFYIPRIPSVPNYVTTYSRSMLKELGENYEQVRMEMWEDPLVPPRVRRPWPVLKLPREHPAQPDPPLGAIDGGCEWEHSAFACFTIRAGEDDDGVTLVHAPSVPRRFPDPPETCTGRMVLNGRPGDVGHATGDPPYDYVWCPHFKARLAAGNIEAAHKLIAEAVVGMQDDQIMADTTGVRTLSRFRVSLRSFPPSYLPSLPTYVTMQGEEEESGGSGTVTPRASTSAETTCSLASEQTTRAADNGQDVPLEEHNKNEGAPSNDVPDDVAPESSQEAATEAAQPDKKPERDDHGKQKEVAASEATMDKFSTRGLPKLEELIPDAFLPDTLLVHDPDRATRHRLAAREPVKYRRVVHRAAGEGMAAHWAPEPHTSEERVAHLHLRTTNSLGSGHHSDVYRAPLTLPPPLSAHSRTGQVTVAAKLAFPWCTAHTLLHNEARAYGAFARHLQEEYCGYNIVPPCLYPVPVGPIVPKFYGFYLPVGEDGKVSWNEDEGAKHMRCDEDEPCRVKWVSPILLMEECGEPVRPEKFTVDQRTECFSLVLRLHMANITQGSFYVRNIMIQPGPLSHPPAARTFDRPSFRIIDFGRAACLSLLWAGVKEKAKRAEILADLHKRMWEEEKQAREQLLIEDLGF
ncbi:hypothetical protein BV20DRAFT_1124167 [Pilatotrama ljubarskyi]|nr:hypothetical protein BV20DRAFT_1124167 [Pilatotrama ljubarskyi]